jgi:predicted RNase H-like nuclease (RuvC/YqgF family)
MELAIDTDVYEPLMDENDKYIDYVPTASKFKHGLRCPCGTRKKDHIFENRQSFKTHIGSKMHETWLSNINTNRTNYYTENIQLKDTINNQKIIIAQKDKELIEKLNEKDKKLNEKDKEINEKNRLIAHLTKKLEMRENENENTDNLIDFLS